MSAIAAAYDRAAPTWLAGPEAVYDHFATALVAAAPAPLRGLRVVDIGAGAGAVSAALIQAGARPVAVDLAPAMLVEARLRFHGLDALAADAVNLPLATASADTSVAGFVLNHLPDPCHLLTEAARVTRPGGTVMAMTYASGPRHPAQGAVEGVAAQWGWSPPAWYQQQREWAALTDTPAGLQAQAAAAGLATITVKSTTVDAGPQSAADLVAWRLGLAHLAAFVGSLGAADRVGLTDDAIAAVGPGSHRLRRRVLILSSSAPA